MHLKPYYFKFRISMQFKLTDTKGVDRKNANEPRHDKTNKVTVRPVKTQISLGIRLV